MYNIQIFYKPNKPVDLSTIDTRVIELDFSNSVSSEDCMTIDRIWGKVAAEKGGKVFSRPRILGTLCDTNTSIDARIFAFRPTEFKTYLGVSLSYSDNLLDPYVYDHMRVAAVGVAVKSADNKVFIHRRSNDATHCGGYLDSSVAGFAFIGNDDKLDFRKAVFEKLERELCVSESEVRSLGLTAVHSSYVPDFSGMFDFLVEINLDSGQLEERIKEIYTLEHHFVDIAQLPDFVFKHYVESQDMANDGAFVLLASLEPDIFMEYRKKFIMHGKAVDFGKLVGGKFEEFTYNQNYE